MKGLDKLKKIWQGLGLVVLLVAVVVGIWQTGIVQNLLPEAGGVKADIVIDTGAILGPMPRAWDNLAQGGEETTPMLDDVVGYMKNLKPEYVRIDHIYDFYDVVGRDSLGKLTFNWSQLDGVVNSILAAGAKPFLSLSYMPPAISSGDVTDPPKDYTEWSIVVSRTISHFSGRAGRNIKGVIYEVWNEPDLFGGWRTYGKKNYLTLYSAAVSGAAATTNTRAYKIGGPATTGLYKNWFDNLLTFTEKNKLRLDFFSWHRYSTDPGVFFKDTQNARKWLESFPGREFDLELMITEWGHDSENNGGYDGMYGAAHTAAVAMEMVNRVDKMFAFEVKDGPDPNGSKYWGRWGLLTHESVGVTPKPRYQALKMLADLADQRLSLIGKGTWVKALAAINEDETQVLLVNYDRKGKHAEKVPITFTSLIDREFLLTTYFLGTAPITEKVATTQAQLKTEIYMPANSIVLVTLAP